MRPAALPGSLALAVALSTAASLTAHSPARAQWPEPTAMPDQEPMLRMGSCMANLDPAALEAMEAKSEAFENDRKRLCKAGQRDAALQRARQFGLEMSTDPWLKQIKACTAGLTLPQQRYTIAPERLNATDICTP